MEESLWSTDWEICFENFAKLCPLEKQKCQKHYTASTFDRFIIDCNFVATTVKISKKCNFRFVVLPESVKFD